MGMNQIAIEALQLMPKERAVLAEKIWDSLESPFFETLDYSDKEAIELAESRDKEMDNDSSAILSHSDLMNSLRV